MNLKLNDISIDEELQIRNEISDETIAEYYDVLREGGKLPPVVVFYDRSKYYLADGWHRFYAHKNAALATIEADVREGTRRDAQLYALGANNDHGLRRTQADKRKAVVVMLNDIEWSEWSDRDIAKQCKVSHPFVAKIRKDMGAQRDEVKSMRGDTEVKLKVNNEPKIQQETEGTDEGFKHQELVDTLAQMQSENEALQDKLAVAAYTGDDKEKEQLEETLVTLRSQIKSLEAENRALKASLKIETEEKNQLIKQVRYWKQQATKGTK